MINIPLLATIIHNADNQSKLSESVFPLAGQRADFSWLILAALFVGAFSLCLINFLFLRSYKLSRQQLESGRRFQLLRQNRSVADYQFPAWVKIAGNLACKVGFVLLAYIFTSSLNTIAIAVGLAISVGFIIFNVVYVLREMLHPRSVLHRRYLFYRISPAFVRMRLFFELCRRFGYFVLGFAFVSYSIQRLTGNGQVFATGNAANLFLMHLQSALTGMSALGTDPVSYTGSAGLLFQLFRGVFAFGVVLSFVNLILSCMSSSAWGNEKGEAVLVSPQKSNTNINLGENDLMDKANVAAFVNLIIEQNLKIPSTQIRPDSDLVRDLGADSLDLIELQIQWEQLLERSDILKSEIGPKRTVGEVVDFLWEQIQKQDAFVEVE